jgi:hypothetical protein
VASLSKAAEARWVGVFEADVGGEACRRVLLLRAERSQFVRSVVGKDWSHPPGLNRRPADYELTQGISRESEGVRKLLVRLGPFPESVQVFHLSFSWLLPDCCCDQSGSRTL